jgi:hypothetical protein
MDATRRKAAGMRKDGGKGLVGLSETELDTPIYRIFPLDRFLQTLSTGENVLVNPTRWEDPFEDVLMARTEIDDPHLGRFPLRNLSDDWYGQCWSLNAETDAMWRIYSHDPNRPDDPDRGKAGVKVRSTIRKLFASLRSHPCPMPSLQFFVGKVEYMTEAQISAMMQGLTFLKVSTGGQGDGFAKLLCVKREAFVHEAEIRLLFQDVPQARAGAMGLFRHAVNVAATFEEVVMDPRLTDANAAVVEGRLRAAGCPLPTRRSDLYRAPSFVIRMQ